MIVDYALVGKRIAKIRKEKKLTQEKLAEKTNLANNYISNIENNRSIPSLETLVKLCEALDVTPNDILLGSSTNSKDYLQNELIDKINSCTADEKSFISDILTLIINKRNKKNRT